MGGIAGKLRSYARSPGMWTTGQPTLATEAADEIDRLTAALQSERDAREKAEARLAAVKKAGELRMQALSDLKGAIRPHLDRLPYSEMSDVRAAFNHAAVLADRALDAERASALSPDTPPAETSSSEKSDGNS